MTQKHWIEKFDEEFEHSETCSSLRFEKKRRGLWNDKEHNCWCANLQLKSFITSLIEGISEKVEGLESKDGFCVHSNGRYNKGEGKYGCSVCDGTNIAISQTLQILSSYTKPE